MTPNGSRCFARFAVDKDKLNKSRAHHRLFQPKQDKVSVEAVDELESDEIREAGDKVAKERGKSLIGWALICRVDIEKIGLSVCVDGDPHPRHANIFDWPKDDDIRVEWQKLLAASARPILA